MRLMLFRKICVLTVLLAARGVDHLAFCQQAEAGATPSPARIEAFIKLCETTRRGAILQFEHELRSLRASGASDLATFRRMRTLQLHLDALRAGKHPVVPTLSFPPEVGAIGRVPRLTCHVDQVLSPQEMLVRVYFPVKVATVQNFRRRGETQMPAVNFMVRGVPTADYHAGSDRELTAVVEVSGRHEPDGENSTPTWVLEPFDMTTVEAHFRHRSDHTP